MRRGSAVVMSAMVLWFAASAQAAAQAPDHSAFCQARMDLEHAILLFGHAAAHQHGDGHTTVTEAPHGHEHGFAPAHPDHGGDRPATDEALSSAAEALHDAAPAELASSAETIVEGLREGIDMLDDAAVTAAFAKIDRFVVDSCGFAVTPVSGTDYAFDAIPESLAPGPAVFEFTNDAPKEDHEMVVVHVHPNVHTAAKKLLALAQTKLERKADTVASAFAGPGSSDVTLADLEAGRYIVYCSVGTGGRPHGKPHWKGGMLTEFDVA